MGANKPSPGEPSDSLLLIKELVVRQRLVTGMDWKCLM